MESGEETPNLQEFTKWVKRKAASLRLDMLCYRSFA